MTTEDNTDGLIYILGKPLSLQLNNYCSKVNWNRWYNYDNNYSEAVTQAYSNKDEYTGKIFYCQTHLLQMRGRWWTQLPLPVHKVLHNIESKCLTQLKTHLVIHTHVLQLPWIQVKNYIQVQIEDTLHWIYLYQNRIYHGYIAWYINFKCNGKCEISVLMEIQGSKYFVTVQLANSGHFWFPKWHYSGLMSLWLPNFIIEMIGILHAAQNR